MKILVYTIALVLLIIGLIDPFTLISKRNYTLMDCYY